LRLSIIIPAHNEADSLPPTLTGIRNALDDSGMDFEVLVVADNCSDATVAVTQEVSLEDSRIRCLISPYPRGYGYSVRAGLELYSGDAVVIMMPNGSDAPRDLLEYHRILSEGYDCAFGSRFIGGGPPRGYPRFKLLVNRVGNLFIRLLFGHGYNDTTNAFKAYRREVIDAIAPLISTHFNLTVEMPLKAIIRGARYKITPVSWTDTTPDLSMIGLREIASRYIFIVLYVFFEHHLTRDDYRDPRRRHRWRLGTSD
jgi:dolichol-phosphate mannosyltransferase